MSVAKCQTILFALTGPIVSIVSDCVKLLLHLTARSATAAAIILQGWKSKSGLFDHHAAKDTMNVPIAFSKYYAARMPNVAGNQSPLGVL